jgi:hypothetical protein
MDQPNDLLKARTEAALLLRLDPSNLSPSDTLRCDLIASLRLVVDDASTSVLDGRAPDLARLLTATESLIKLLPSDPPQPANKQEDPRQYMWRTYKQMRDRGELGERAAEPSLRVQIDQLQAENEQLKAQLAERYAASVPPPPDNVVSLHTRVPSETGPDGLVPMSRMPSAPPKPATGGLLTDDAPEPWREHLNRNFDPWADNRR